MVGRGGESRKGMTYVTFYYHLTESESHREKKYNQNILFILSQIFKRF